jgi:hypothetical protein
LSHWEHRTRRTAESDDRPAPCAPAEYPERTFAANQVGCACDSRGFGVIELPAGTLHRHETVDGDRLVIETIDQAPANIPSCTDQTMKGSQRGSGCFSRVSEG